jgi:hypothetical protein
MKWKVYLNKHTSHNVSEFRDFVKMVGSGMQGQRIWKAKTWMFIFNRVQLGKATNVRVLQLFRKERGLARRAKDRRSAVPQRLEESL